MLDPALEIPAAHAQAGEDRQNRADDDPTIHAAPVGPAYLVKPFDDKLLLDRIARLVNPPRASKIETKMPIQPLPQEIWGL